MKRFLQSFISLPFLLASCVAPPKPEPVIKKQVLSSPEITEKQKAPAPSPKVPPEIVDTRRHPLTTRLVDRSGTELTLVTFDRRDHELVVVDQKGGPGSRLSDARGAGRGHLAAINGGFFTPSGSPLGLVVTQGERRGAINRRSFLGTGFFLGPQARLMSRTQYLAAPPKHREILQSGPRLVWSGETLAGLSSREKRPRSFLIWDGQNHFGLGYADSATLKGLSELLKKQPVSGFKIAYALNLDGGRSSDLWVSSAVDGGGLTRSSFLNKDVRNYLVLKKKSARD